ncbi:uncharacterized protein K489DRAFT_44671 [Dissoconium aciculare CBS 342.82]|uniref:Uncharacterized protein n=1 Tax=Dissoconium aciculare CBS 342.82 TaxID=1314786 RepID=A0A6J3LYK6_9PEZI|nr:uncharacterized protein K489DRAFT_44671 [Dissoconium aciculare CBS 342.82]KAF1820846.1 hypothetical protein K489DRAFT_44671 [Dissoconium aciculare CBS 342.82]
MQLSTAIILTLTASHLSNAFLLRNDRQISALSPRSAPLIFRADANPPLPRNEVCFYLTDGLNWTGTGHNMCGQTGICSESCDLSSEAHPLTWPLHYKTRPFLLRCPRM